MGKSLQVFLLHNVVAPYRLPVFEEISKHIDLEVYFCKDKTSDRKWDASLGGYTFKRFVLPDFQIGPFFINPTLLWRLLRRKYDVYLVGDFPEMAFATFITIAVAKLRRKPIVLWSETINHDVIYFQNLAKSTKLQHRLILFMLTMSITGYRRLLLRLPDRFVALSEMARTFLQEEGISPQLIRSGIQVMPRNLLDSPDTDKTASPYAGKKLVLYLGYFNPLKGIDTLISAFAQINDPNTRLAIVGAGPEEDMLRKQAASDSRIDFYGYTVGADRANLMKWADVLALPTLADCWAIVVNESLYYGTPVITTSAAGASEIIRNGVNGMVIPPQDEKALVDALAQVLKGEKSNHEMSLDNQEFRERITDTKVGARPILDALLDAGKIRK